MTAKSWTAWWVVLGLVACVALAAPRSRPARLVATPGTPKPDGCAIEVRPSRASPSPGLEEIGTVSAVALSDGACLRHLLHHEACAYGGDELYALELVSAPGSDTEPLVCQAHLARRPGAG